MEKGYQMTLENFLGFLGYLFLTVHYLMHLIKH